MARSLRYSAIVLLPSMETRLRLRWPIVLICFCMTRAVSAQNVPPILLGHQVTVVEPPPAPEIVPVTVNANDKPLSAFSISALSLRDSIVALVRAQLGRKYRRGGDSPEHGFDCSGLVQYVMSALKIDLPRTAKYQARAGLGIPRDTSELKPGDLLTFAYNGTSVSHIGIYVGDGRFVHASSAAGRVIESALDRPIVRHVKPWRGVRRVLTDADSATTSSQ
jgi:cell wall-associated NlpC family hydrolase